MDANALICVQLDAAPEMIEPWLQTLAQGWTSMLPARYEVGPATRTPGSPLPYETLAIYVVDATPTKHGQVALAVTYVPLRPSRACLELRGGGSFLPATLETVVQQCATAFASQFPVVSSVATPLDVVGAPPLACNRWLDAQVAKLGRGQSPERELVYQSWLEQYRALRGDTPADPRRSFRAALVAARRRVRCAGRR